MFKLLHEKTDWDTVVLTHWVTQLVKWNKWCQAVGRSSEGLWWEHAGSESSWDWVQLTPVSWTDVSPHCNKRSWNLVANFVVIRPLNVSTLEHCATITKLFKIFKILYDISTHFCCASFSPLKSTYNVCEVFGKMVFSYCSFNTEICKFPLVGSPGLWINQYAVWAEMCRDST